MKYRSQKAQRDRKRKLITYMVIAIVVSFIVGSLGVWFLLVPTYDDKGINPTYCLKESNQVRANDYYVYLVANTKPINSSYVSYIKDYVQKESHDWKKEDLVEFYKLSTVEPNQIIFSPLMNRCVNNNTDELIKNIPYNEINILSPRFSLFDVLKSLENNIFNKVKVLGKKRLTIISDFSPTISNCSLYSECPNEHHNMGKVNLSKAGIHLVYVNPNGVVRMKEFNFWNQYFLEQCNAEYVYLENEKIYKEMEK